MSHSLTIPENRESTADIELVKRAGRWPPKLRVCLQRSKQLPS